MVLFGWSNYRLSVRLPASFSHGNLNLFLRIFNWSANESKTLSLSDQSRQGSVLEVSPRTVRVEGQRARMGKSVWSLADLEVSRLRCVIVKETDNDKLATVSKNEALSINQLTNLMLPRSYSATYWTLPKRPQSVTPLTFCYFENSF